MTDTHPILRSLIKAEWPQILASVILAIGQSAALYPVALLVNRIIDIHIPNKDSKALSLTILFIIILFLANALMVVTQRYVSIRIVKRQVAKIRIQAVDSIIFRSRPSLSEKDRDLLHTHIVQDSMRYDGFLSSLLNQFVPSLLVSLGLAIVVASLNLALFTLFLVLVPVMLLLNRWVGGAYRSSVSTYHNDFSQFSKKASFIARHDDLIHISSAECLEHELSSQRIEALRKSMSHTSMLSALHTLAEHQVILIGSALALLAGSLLVIRGELSVGSLISFYVAVGLLSAYARSAISSIPNILEGLQSLDRLSSIFQEGTQVPYSGKIVIKSIQSIEFSHVWFGFENKQEILKDVSFFCNVGDTVWLKGPSGCGKTTIAMLMLGFYKPTKGVVSINGIAMDELDVQQLRRLIGMSMQDQTIFSASVRDNLTYGLEPLPDDSQVMEACKLVEIDSTIIGLPQGLDTLVGERGSLLSGGERQKLAIARALLRNPQLLILDEPENNLPLDNAREIIGQTAQANRIRFIISHRQAMQADQEELEVEVSSHSL